MSAELLKKLEEKLLGYYPDVNLPLVRKAYDFAQKRHEGQLRVSGEPYIVHPINVAMILADIHLDLDSILTAILHDTVEDTSATLQEIETQFGKMVAELVDGVTKISRITFRTTAEKQAENFRKMIVAMAKDLRVILVKLADRLHNMQTLQYLPEAKQKIIAQETLDIYAPLANRLGLSWMKAELEDLCLRYLKPETYYKLAQIVAKKKSEREKYINEVRESIIEKLKEYSLNGTVTGRPKHFYSIYKKMENHHIEFDEIHDIIAFRIVLENITECYKALGIIHSAFKPVQGRFKDYIAMPKPNNYQSLHTTVIGPYGERIEIQIRTEEMNEIAQHGIAAHWKYKEGKANLTQQNQLDWLNRLVDFQKTLQDPTEFLESVKLDLYQGDVYVFTPKGEVKEFPHGSTPLDFAYSVHTDVGNHCAGAKVNGKIVPLKYRLRSGDTIEILTSPHLKPSKDWLKLVRSGRAKSKIRAFLKQEERDRAVQLGREILDREFRRYQLNLDKLIKSSDFNKSLKDFGVKNNDDLFVAVGYGKLVAKQVIEKVSPSQLTKEEKIEAKEKSFLERVFATAKKKSESRNAVMVGGMDDILIRFAKCCDPIPGDAIVGFVTRGRGVTVHKADCPKALASDLDRKIAVDWNRDAAKPENIRRAVRVQVHCDDTPGLLATMSQTISAFGVNISQATVRTTKDKKAICVFEILVSGVDQLNKLMSMLESKPGIISVRREHTY